MSVEGLIVFGESSRRRALQQYLEHYHGERNHQGKDNRILFPSRPEARNFIYRITEGLPVNQ